MFAAIVGNLSQGGQNIGLKTRAIDNQVSRHFQLSLGASVVVQFHFGDSPEIGKNWKVRVEHTRALSHVVDLGPLPKVNGHVQGIQPPVG